MLNVSRKMILAIKKRNIVPSWLKNRVLQYNYFFNLRGEKWKAENPFRQAPDDWNGSGSSPYVLGIVKEFWHMHWPYIAACRELDVSYKILDISGPDWLDVLRNSNCDAFLVRPSVQMSAWKQMYDERLRTLSLCDNRPIFPDFEALWMWESKRRMHYWLKAHNIPHPKTWVFYNLESALDYASECDLPIVFKSDMGSGASGVRIFSRRTDFVKHIRKCFLKGFSTYRRARFDREYGSVLLQEYLPDVREWRTIRIGDSYLAYEKVPQSGFHSGSHLFHYERPSDELLNFTKHVSDIGHFQCINIDIFITKENKLLANELQAIIGQQGSRELCRVDGVSGRMVMDRDSGKWKFEPGEFCKNFLFDLRVKTLLQMLDNATAG
jgi:hypothetical protein